MFTLTLHDRNGKELKIGDFVKISDGSRFKFYAEVKYLEKEQVITPFHTFSFHSFEKVDKLPDGVVWSIDEPRYKICWLPNDEEDMDANSFKDYLMSWRECEHNLEKRQYRIKLINPTLFPA